MSLNLHGRLSGKAFIKAVSHSTCSDGFALAEVREGLQLFLTINADQCLH